MRFRVGIALAACCTLALGVAACGSDDSDSASGSGGTTQAQSSAPEGGSINGAGATFPQPVYGQWSSEYKNANQTSVNYQGIGSGGGIAQFTEGTVNFGATDAAMTDEELAAAEKKGVPYHVPTVFGAVTVSYKLNGVDKGLKLDGATLADIFLGRISTWSDQAIASQNPGVKLPDEKITVVHRSDESGTTKLFTTYLAGYSSEWESGPGVDKSVKWPTGTGVKGNNGVAAAVNQTEGSIGYVELAYALQNNFTFAAMKNKSGQYVEPGLASTSAAGEGVKIPADLRFDAIDSPNPEAYPIASATFILVWQDGCKSAKQSKGDAQRVQGFVNYGLNGGQSVAKQLQYAPLPADIKKQAQAKVDAMKCNGQRLS